MIHELPSLERKKTASNANKIATATWLGLLTAASVTKIVVGSLYVDGGCLGFSLLPYYLIIGGILALIPACIAVLASFYKKSRDLEDFWDLLGKLFIVSIALMIAATIYILVSASRVTSLDRLCTDQWVPVFGFCILGADWILFALFFRLFCVNTVSESTQVSAFQQDEFGHEESPFYLWKQRHNESF
ncbi:uncharacterized protein LOC101861141 [Aplysia californica]|uniref:Uncharacterized protein LOC101861141 n=1 Tax=Aplysia californica TaxID=6500 RepID=A0ABM0JXX1_APLCA|nr:uncharacterized protein LOC101861141 [Aplysia californica]